MCVTLAYAFLTLVVTYPVSTNIKDGLAQHGDWAYDGFHYTYLIWWAREALFELHASPADLQLVNYPFGFQNPLVMTYALFYLVGLIFKPFLSAVATFNVLTLLAFFLSGISACALCTYLTGNRWAGFFGGLVYAFSPCHIAHAISGHLDLISIYPFPVYLLLLIRGIRQPRKATAVLCALALAASMLVQPLYIPYLLVPITAIWLIYELVVLRLRVTCKMLLYLLGTFGIAGALILPFYWPLFCLQLQQGGDYLVQQGLVAFSADLLGFISPPPSNPILNSLGLIPEYAHRATPEGWLVGEAMVYLGFVPLMLAVLGAWHGRRKWGAWVLVAVVAAVLSLGPFLKVGGQLVSFEAGDGIETRVPLPYALLAHLPVFSLGRTPARFTFTLVLALAVLSAHGLNVLLRRLPYRWGFVFLVALSLLTMSECLIAWPYPMTELQIPSGLSDLAETPDDAAILGLPPMPQRAKLIGLFYQTLHQHPLFDGWVQRPPRVIPKEPEFLAGLLAPHSEPDIIPRPGAGTRAAVAQALDVGYVLLQTRYVEEAAYTEFLTLELGEPSSVDEGLVIYRVSSQVEELWELVYVLPGEQWLSRRHWTPIEDWAGRPARWMSESAELYIYSPHQQEGVLRLAALPLLTPQRLQIEVNGTSLPPLVIGDYMTYTTSAFILQPGLNQIVFRAMEGCTPFVGDPRCQGPARAAGADCNPYLRLERCLSFIFQNIRFQPTTAGPAEHPLDIVLGDRVRFLGYDLRGTLVPGQPVSLTLYWQALDAIGQDYTIFVHLLRPDGHLLTQHDAPPLDGTYPTSRWVVGDVFSHRVSLMIPADASPGRYELFAGMYTYPDIIRLPVASDRPYAQDGLIWLQSVENRP